MRDDLRAKNRGSPILPPTAPINLQLTFDLPSSHFGILTRQAIGTISGDFNLGSYAQKHEIMAESNQGDDHDKAWKKAEKKFAQYVETLSLLTRWCIPLFCTFPTLYSRQFMMGADVYRPSPPKTVP